MAICKIETFSEEEIINIISSSHSAKEALERFGYKKTNNAPLIRKYAQKYNIDISHYPIKGTIENLKDKRFGKLTVISLNVEITQQKKNTYWNYKCDCGNTYIVRAADLKRGSVKSCGCLKLNGKVKNLTNMCFGNLKVLSKNLEKSGKGNSTYWNVVCTKCNVVGVIRGDTIQSRKSFNCNCPHTSKNESLIADFLTKNHIKFESQFSFPELIGEKNKLYFDFKINNILLEYQGEQHFHAIEYFGGQEKFEKRVKYDSLKKEYCKKNNIKLYEITYKDNTIRKLKEILKKEGFYLES